MLSLKINNHDVKSDGEKSPSYFRWKIIPGCDSSSSKKDRSVYTDFIAEKLGTESL